MKLKKLEFKQILKIYLLKYRTYEQPLSKNNNINLVIDSTLNEVIFNFKRALQIIFQYHMQNKQILFVGAPIRLETKINKTTRHSAISKDMSIQGLISNHSSKSLTKTKQIDNLQIGQFKPLLPKLSKTPDLIVIVEHEKIGAIYKECAVARLPIINFSLGNVLESTYSSYNLQPASENLNSTIDKNLLAVGLSFLFRISKIKDKKFPDLNPITNKKKFTK